MTQAPTNDRTQQLRQWLRKNTMSHNSALTDGGIDYIMGSVVEIVTTEKQALLDRIGKEVIEPAEIPYNEFSKCPSCGQRYMYRCTCSDASDYILSRQRKALASLKAGLGGGAE